MIVTARSRWENKKYQFSIDGVDSGYNRKKMTTKKKTMGGGNA